jgi:transposase-like protein
MRTIETEVEKQKRDRQGRRITPVARRVELVEGYRASGLTMEQFARQEGIKWQTLAKWCHLHGRGGRTKTLNFTEVKLGPAAPITGAVPAWAFELTLPNGWVVRAADASGLAQLLSVVR